MDMNKDGELVSPLPDRASATGLEPLATFSVGGFLDEVASAVRLKLPHAILLFGQVIKVAERNWGWTFSMIDPASDNTATAARVSAKIDKTTLRRISDQLGFELIPGMIEGSVIGAHVRAEFHKVYALSVRLVGLDAAITAGLVAGRIEAIRAALIATGVHDAQRHLAEPDTILRVGVIAPAKSASLGDVMAELARWRDRGIIEAVVLIPAVFEGPRAAKSLQDAFIRARALARINEVDIVLLVRGGGDAAGLAASADEWAARALLNVPVPVIAGFGHERDQHLLADLAWRSAGTPSKAVAELWRLVAEPARAALRDWSRIRHATNRAITSDHGPELERRRECLVEGTVGTLRATSAELSGYRHVVAHRGGAVLVELHALQRELDRHAEALLWDASACPGREADRLRELYRAAAADAYESLDRLDNLADGQVAVASALVALFQRQGEQLIRALQDAEAGARRILLETQSELHAANDAVQVLDTDRALDAGYVLAVRQDGAIIRGAAEASQASMLSLIFRDGVVAVVPLNKTEATVH